MSDFVKYFLIAFTAQAAMLLFILLTGIADFVMYLLYMLPYLFVGMIVKLPDQIGGDSAVTLYLLLCLPAILYSLLVAGILLMIKRVTNRSLS